MQHFGPMTLRYGRRCPRPKIPAQKGAQNGPKWVPRRWPPGGHIGPRGWSQTTP